MNKRFKIVLAVISIFLLLLIFLFLIRFFSHKEVDDVSPKIPCLQKYLKKADIGLHGINHKSKEFLKNL